MKSLKFAKRQYLRRLKVVIRGQIPPRYWSLVADLTKVVFHKFVEILATMAAVSLKVLPDGVLVALRERLALRRPLDYDRALITLCVTSRTEQEIRLRSCEKEPETIAWIHQTMKPRDVLYDIGANIGAYSLIAAVWTKGQAIVYAFEPGYSTFPNLVENIFANQVEQSVIPFQVALGDQTTLTNFCYSTVEAGGASHGGIRDVKGLTPVVRRQVVLSYRLADFVQTFGLRLPTHMKIDVDGSEVEVVRGAKWVLSAPCLQWILIEVDESKTDYRAVQEILEQAGFLLQQDYHHSGSVHNLIFRRGPWR